MAIDVDGLRTELQAHQRRLAALRERAATQGISADPAVYIEINGIEKRVREIEAQLAGAPAAKPEAQPEASWMSDLPTAGGDVIVGQVGAGASQVAIGKQIQQGGAPADHSDELAAIGSLFDSLQATFSAIRPQLDATTAEMAAFQLTLLRGELSKPNDEPPSAGTMTMVGDWLIGHVPALSGSLTALMRSAAVARRVARAGPAAIQWAELRFSPS